MQDEKLAVGMWSNPASLPSSDPYHEPDVTLRLNNLNDSAAASSSDSDVSSSKIGGSPSGGLELDADSSPSGAVAALGRRPDPAASSPIPEFYSVAEKTAMLGIAEAHGAGATAFPVHPATRLFRYSEAADRSRIHGANAEMMHHGHGSSLPQAGSGSVTHTESYFEAAAAAAAEHRAGFPHANRSGFGEPGSHPQPRIPGTIFVLLAKLLRRCCEVWSVVFVRLAGLSDCALHA